MEKILIIYASKQGQTKKIAEVISTHLRKFGYWTEVINIERMPNDLDVRKYEGIIVGAGVHDARYPSKLRQWIKTNQPIFSLKSTAFYSVCLGILQNSPGARQEEDKIKRDLFDETGWYPDSSAIFAGALQYSKYNWILKKVMHNIVQQAGVETDTKKDYEYTDWKEVEKFAHHFHIMIQPDAHFLSDGLYVVKKNS